MKRFLSGLALMTALGAVPAYADVQPYFVIISNLDPASPYPFQWVDNGAGTNGIDRSTAEDFAALYRTCDNVKSAHAAPYQAWYHQVAAWGDRSKSNRQVSLRGWNEAVTTLFVRRLL